MNEQKCTTIIQRPNLTLLPSPTANTSTTKLLNINKLITHATVKLHFHITKVKVLRISKWFPTLYPERTHLGPAGKSGTGKAFSSSLVRDAVLGEEGLGRGHQVGEALLGGGALSGLLQLGRAHLRRGHVVRHVVEHAHVTVAGRQHQFAGRVNAHAVDGAWKFRGKLDYIIERSRRENRRRI